MENDEMTNDAAVAWRWWSAWESTQTNVLGPGRYLYGDAGEWHPEHASALVPATTVAELRDNAAKWKSLHDAMVLVHDVQERRIGRMTVQLEAAERRVAELREVVRYAVGNGEFNSAQFTEMCKQALARTSP